MAARGKSRSASNPWGGRVAREVARRVAEGWPSGLTTFTGDDAYHLDAAYESVLASLVPDRSDPFAWTSLAATKIPTVDAVEAACASGMFSRRRVVVVRDGAALDGSPDPLERFAAKPPESSWLLVRAPRLDRKRKLHQALLAGTALEFRLPADRGEAGEAAREVVEMARARGLSIRPDAAAFLLDACRLDLHRAARELERLRDLAGDGETDWPLERLREHVAGNEAMSGWEIGDAVARRDLPGGWRAVRRLLDRGHEPIPILGGLGWRARVFAAAQARVAAGEPPRAVARSAGAWRWEEALEEGLSRYRWDEVLAFPARLLEADRALKSRGLSGSAVLESLVEDLIR